MRVRLLWSTLLVGLSIGFTLPAVAQQNRDHRGNKDDKDDKNDKDEKRGDRDHRGHRPPSQQAITVSGFAPQSGPVGTKVTITGTGFTKQTKVVVGGRPVKEDSLIPVTIVFTVPGRIGDGRIVLRQPGVANDVDVGTFTLDVEPRIGKFQPIFGPIGARVEILGEGFRNGDQILLNGKALPIAELAANRILVTIVPGSTSGFLVLSRAGKQFAANRQFNVTLPAPTISGFAPTAGTPGTVVKISGANFDATDRTYYGGAIMRVGNRGEGWFEVTVPPNARESAVIAVRSPRGTAVTAQPFQLVLPPSIERFAPTYGGPGTRVEIFGANFLRGDEVKLGGRTCRVLAYDDRKMTVEIPADGRSDLFSLWRGAAQLASTRAPFTIVARPTITGFAPTAGAPGTRVTITGSGFTPDAVVLYGPQRLRAVNRAGETSIEVIVPGANVNNPFVVKTRGGEAQTAAAFQIQVSSVVTSVSPTSGPAGTRVWIRGRNFNPTDAFFLGGAALAIVERQPEGYVVTIPAGAQSGLIEKESYGRRQATRFRFEVLNPPKLAGFSPTSGPPGTQITVTGAEFGNRTAVFFGSMPLPVTRRVLPSQLVVVIPQNAAGTDYLFVEEGGQRVKSQQTFQVISPPVISGFAPTSGRVGAEVKVTGSNLTNTTVVMLGKVANMPIVRKELPSALIVQVPPGLQGSHPIWLMDNGQKVRSQAAFTIVVPPSISGIQPLSGPPGTQVTIAGDRFTPGANVWFGALACPIIKRSANQLVASIPAAAKGKDNLVVEDMGEKVRSAQPFEVTAPPSEQPPPAGHPQHEHPHQHPHEVGDHHHHPHAHPHRPGANHHHPY